MKNVLKLSKAVVLFVGLSLVLLSCGDDKESKPKNRVKVDGKSFDFKRGYIVSEQITEGEAVLGSAHWVYLTGGDLEIADNLVMTGEGPFLAMYIGSTDDVELIEGTYDMEYQEYDFGNVIFFDLYENFSLSLDGETVVDNYDAWYSGDTEGDVKISRSGDKYTIKVGLDEYYFLGDSETEAEEQVSEEVTGYFNGELETLTVEESPAKMSSALRKLRRVK
ncbi:MAG: hypothetical protein U0U09_02555 [Cyclobacteriaceae bacterium]